jgi:hypothetical protein
MVRSPFEVGLRFECRDIATGAQTERRDGAGPAGACFGGKDPAGRFLSHIEIE